MKKVLIWNTYELQPTGGPVGYLYNIKKYTDENNINNIVFLSDLIDISITKKRKYDYLLLRTMKRLYNIFNLNNFFKLKIFIKYIYSTKEYNKININLNEFNFIHFHTSYEFTKYSKLLADKGFKGKTILTTHAPKPTYLEIIEDWNNLQVSNIPKKILKKLKEIDFFAFSNTDILLFPDKTALEPYKVWKEFDDILKKDNFNFIPTGINLVQHKETKENILRKFHIPSNSFVVTYVGRHNEIKGYDLLKQFAEIILNKYDNIYFLIAGKESPLTGIKHQRWIEVGWTNDPFSIINACDIFILPNKETFFDLILLEVMSLNKPVMLSSTGGNKYFINQNLDLYYFKPSSIGSMISVFENEIMNKEFCKNVNQEFITENMLISNYVTKYLDFIEKD